MFNALLDGFSISTFLSNAQDFAIMIGRYVIIIIGVVMIIAGIYQIAKGLMSGGKGQVNWVMSILCLLVGGALVAGGISWVAKIAGGGKTELESMGSTAGQYSGKGNAGGATLSVTVDGSDYIVSGLE